MIYWIGNSENWDKPIHGETAIEPYIFPLVEETVLEVAFSPLYAGFTRLSREAAINCTSRFALRSALPEELNPKWVDWHGFDNGLVVKAPASCQNQGIGFALPNEYSRRLAQYDRIVGNIGVVEQYIPGPQYEADGVVINGQAVLLGWSQQEGENGKIVQYIRLPVKQGEFGFEAPAEVIETAVKALGLDNCPFCFEMKCIEPEVGEPRSKVQWKIVDAHARLGEDRRLWGDQAVLFDRIEKIIEN